MPDIYQYPTASAKVLEETGKNVGMTVERIEFSDGIRIYTKEHPHPHKGLPTPEALVAVNSVKRWAKLLLRFKVAPSAFWAESERVMRPHILKPEFQQAFTRELTYLLAHFVSHEKAELIAHIFEYDAAYRYRVQDLMGETNAYSLSRRPIREIWRLVGINKARDYPAVSDKVRRFAQAAILALCLPPVRGRFRDAVLATNLAALRGDESELYWRSKQLDYKYGA